MQANLYISASCHLLNRNTGGPGLVDSVSEVADARARVSVSATRMRSARTLSTTCRVTLRAGGGSVS